VCVPFHPVAPSFGRRLIGVVYAGSERDAADAQKFIYEISTQFYKRVKVLNLISNFDPSRPVSSSFPNETAHLNLILCEFHESICIHYDEVSLNVWEESAYQKGQKQMYPL